MIDETDRRHEEVRTEHGEEILKTAQEKIALAAYHELKLGIVEPATKEEAEKTEKWETGWKPAIAKEKASLDKLKVYEVVHKSECRRPMDGKIVLKLKLKSDGTVEKYKARLCLRGFMQIEGVK